MYRRVDITEVPFVRGDLTIRLHVPLARQQVQLLLRKRGVNHGEWDTVERGIPSCEERVFPSALCQTTVTDMDNGIRTCRAWTTRRRCEDASNPAQRSARIRARK